MRRLRSGLRALVQRGLVWLGDRANLFLTQGLVSPRHRFDHRAFMSGKLWTVSTDVVRNATLELVARELKAGGIAGDVAEVGVFQGDFAALVNLNFDDRDLLLFDTFEGFHPADIGAELEQGTSDIPHDFAHTSPEMVLAKMPHRERVQICDGWFPASATPYEGRQFCFVSIDVDLYQPIRHALEWFYPRLVPRGYIFVHDYNNDQYRGVRKAVDDFVGPEGVPYFLMPDAGGTVVLTKVDEKGKPG